MVLIRFIFIAALFHFYSLSASALEITLDDLKGLKPMDSSQNISGTDNGKEKVLYFWATWCGDCKEKLTSYFKDAKNFEKYDVYLVATDKDISKIQHYQKKNAIEPRIVLDPDRVLQKKLSVFSVPTFIKLKKQDQKLLVTANQSGGDIRQLLE
jgi:thiol-disulfide isomerase/thioredoxin